MADLKILRPQAGQQTALQNLENARIVLAFPPTDAVLERVGDDLVFKFEDGGQVALTDFYGTYTAENLPAFEIDGSEVSGKDFFVALGEDLMPAAGPAAAAAPSGGRYNEFGSDSLMGGVDRLDGLDVGFDGAGVVTDDTLGGVNSLGGVDVAAASAPATGGGTGDTGGEPELPPVPPLTPIDPPVPPLPPVDMDALKDLNLGTVFEGALADGTMKNSDGSDLSRDDIFSNLGGLPAGWEVVGGGNASGKLVQDADGNWRYELTNPSAHPDQGNDSSTGKVEVILKDPFGRDVTVEVDVDVVDDAPITGADNCEVTEGGVVEGNVLDNDTSGADKWLTDENGKPAPVTGVTAPAGWEQVADAPEGDFVFKSDAGTMVINKDGSYTFTSNPDSTTADTSFEFTYTVTDKGGDTADGTLNVDVKDVTLGDTSLGGGVGGAAVDEAEMDHNKGAVSEPVEFTLPDGASFDSNVKFDGGVATVPGANGIFTITDLGGGNYSYTYKLTTPILHEGTNGELKADADSVKLPISDANGNKGNVELTVDVKDDVPEFIFTSDPADTIKPGGAESGMVILDAGADGADWSTFAVNGNTVSFDQNGKASLDVEGGKLELTRNGNDISYTYTAADGTTNLDVDLKFSVKDTDGDQASADVKVIVKDGQPTIDGLGDPSTGATDLTANESDIASGTATPEHSFTFTAPDGLTSATIGGVEIAKGAVVEGKYGNLVVTDLIGPDESGQYTVKYEYQITDNAQHADGDAENTELADPAKGESFEVAITDKGSDTPAKGTIDVAIKDDVPEITVDKGETTEGPGNNLDEFKDLNFHDYVNGDLKDFSGGKQSIEFEGVTVSAGYVTYGDKGLGSEVTGFAKHENHTLGKHGVSKSDQYHGLTIGSGHAEINMFANGKAAEAVEFNLNGKLAYGIDLTLGCFFSEGSTDTAAELARVSFYRDGKLIYTADISSNKADGVFNADGAFKEYLSGGFDRVIISPVDNGHNNNSEFIIRDIGFETIPEPKFITKGTVTGDSGADGFHTGTDADSVNYTNATFNYTDGQTMKLVDKDGVEFGVTLKVDKGTSGGDGMVSAYDANGNLVFKGVLDKDGNWSFNQYREFSSVDGGADGNKDTFDLSFITKDKDGDIAIGSVPIDTTPGENTPVEPTPIPPAQGDGMYEVVWGAKGITDVEGPNFHHKPNNGNGNADQLQSEYDAGDGFDTLQLQGSNNNAPIIVDAEGNIKIPTHDKLDDQLGEYTIFKNFETVVGKNGNNDKYELTLDGQNYSVDADGNVTVYLEGDKTLVFECVKEGSITGGTQISPDAVNTQSFTLMADEGDALLFGQLESYDDASAAVLPLGQAEYLDDGDDDLDALLGDRLGFGGSQDGLAQDDAFMGDVDGGLTSMDTLCDKLGITQNSDGTLNLGDGWQATTVEVPVDATEGALAFTSQDDLSIVVQESLIKSDTGAA